MYWMKNFRHKSLSTILRKGWLLYEVSYSMSKVTSTDFEYEQ
ncbi:hypothetical protein VCR3J2_110034 [Vibrio coralliirubri]|nr:hypothetical protein VCR3J2_110034 [Vibrio coralliirubri]